MYLSSEQALADLAYFIESINAQYNFGPNTKWIAFGGSYPGSLAAWLREKYPHLVYGAISSSGPLLAKIDFFGTVLKFEVIFYHHSICFLLIFQNIMMLLLILSEPILRTVSLLLKIPYLKLIYYSST